MIGEQEKRCNELYDLGLMYNGQSYIYDMGVVFVEVSHLDTLTYNEEKWEKVINTIKMAIK